MRFNSRFPALLLLACCAGFASRCHAEVDWAATSPKARLMLERAWAQIDTTMTIEFEDSVAQRVGPQPRAAAPESLRTLAKLLMPPQQPDLFEAPWWEMPALLFVPADSAGKPPNARIVLVRTLVSFLGVVDRAQVMDGPRDRWPAALLAAMSLRFRPGQRDGVTIPTWVEVPF